MIDMSCGDTALIRAVCDRHGATVQQTAYILATGWWETARTMKPVREGFYLGDRADACRRTPRRKARVWAAALLVGCLILVIL